MQQYNCYSILASVRLALNEYSEAYVQGTDSTGRFNNIYLLEKINEAYRELYAFLVLRMPHLFMAETKITGVNSVYTLPGDFGALVEFRNPDGFQIFPVSWNDRKWESATGTKFEYYRSGNTLVINQPGLAETYTLYYKKKCRNLEMGQAQAGSGALALKMSAASNNTDDYYNGFGVENITQDTNETISDYVGSTLIATVTGTPAENDFYGLTPEIPEPFMHLIQRRAVMMIREEYPLAQVANSAETYAVYKENMANLLITYADLLGDVPSEEDYEDLVDFED
jgi:hypothetical protein